MELPGTGAGLSVHHEIWLYVNRCHLTPEEALQSATSKPGASECNAYTCLGNFDHNVLPTRVADIEVG